MATAPPAPAPMPIPALAPVDRPSHFSAMDFGGGLFSSWTVVELPLLFFVSIASFHRKCDNILDHLDTVPITRIIRVLILLAGRKVVHANLFDDHGVRSLIVVDHTSCPIDGTLGVFRVTSGPDTESNVTRGLREVLPIQSVFSVQSTDQLLVNIPLDLLLGPVGGVVVEFGVGIGNVVVPTTVVGRVVSFAVVVGLYLGGVVADPFPVDLVQIVGLQDNTAHDTTALGHLDVGLDNTEEDVKLGLQGR